MKNSVLKFSLILVIMLSATLGFATTYSTVQDGPWSTASTWDNQIVPPPHGVVGDAININHVVSISGYTDNKNYVITINSSGVINGTGNHTQNLSDNLKLVNYGKINIRSMVLASSSTEVINHGEMILSDELTITNGSFTNKPQSQSVGEYPYVEVKRLSITLGGKLDNYHHFKVMNKMNVLAASGDVVNHLGAVLYAQNGVNINSPGIENNGSLYIDGKITNINVSGSGSTCNSGGNSVAGSQQSCTSGPIDPSFPIDLVFFSAKSSENAVELSWTTATEENNDYFTIERSQDGQNWESLGTIRGAGNANELLQYSYVDQFSLRGDTYYHLKQTDYDGSFTYSGVRVVNIDEEDADANINVFPNPTLDQVQLDVKLSNINAIRVFNLVGQDVTSKVSISQNGENSFQLSLLSLAAGLYFIQTPDASTKVYKQ